MRAHLVQIDAQDSAGVAVPVRLASVDDRRLCHLGGTAWMPAIAKLPTLAYDFYGGDFQGRITTPTGSFVAALTGLPDLGNTRFSGARIRIWSGELGADFSAFVLRLDGHVPNEPSVEAGLASFDCRPDDAWLDKPLLALFTGEGGVEGPDDLEGAVKPLTLGNCRFAPGTLIDAVDLIYRVSCYGEVYSIYAAYDRVASLGASQGDFVSLAALLAADVPAGSWATCSALGLVRLGAPADGQVSFDIAGDSAGAGGYVRKPGAIIRRIAEIAGGTVDPANLAALDAARPWNLSLVLLSQTTAREVIQELAGSVCAVAGVSLTGTLFVQPLGLTTPTLTLDAEGRFLPPVEEVTAQAMATPYWRHTTNAEISWVVHDPASVATGYNYRGRWKAARTYRADDMVDLENGSAWAFIADSAQAGVEPGTDAAVWEMLAGPTTYSDGTPIDALQPAEPGADVTSYFVGPGAVPIECNGDRVALPGQIPAVIAYKLFKGNADITASASWSVTVLNGTATASIGAATGILTISALGSDVAALRISTLVGATTRHLDVQVSRSFDTFLSGQASLAKPTAYLTVPAVTLYAYVNGNITSYASATGQFRVMLGGTDVSSGFTFAITGNPANLSASVSGNTYAVTGGLTTDSATLAMRATGTGTYAGTVFDLVFTVSRVLAGYQIVTALPTANNFEGREVYLSTDGKRYTYTGGVWVASLTSASVLADNQIASMSATKLLGTITPSQFSSGIGGNRLIGATPATRPDLYFFFASNNNTGSVYQQNATYGGPVLSPLPNGAYPDLQWTLPDFSGWGVHQTNTANSGLPDYFAFRYVRDNTGATTADFACEDGKYYELSVYSGAHRCNVDVIVVAVDAAGNWVGQGTIGTAGTNAWEKQGGTTLNAWKRIVSRVYVPPGAGATRLICYVRKWGTIAGQSDSWMFLCYPMLAECSPNATSITPWSAPPQAIILAQNIYAKSLTAQSLAVNAVGTDELAARSVTAKNLTLTDFENLMVDGDLASGGLSAYSRLVIPGAGQIRVADGGLSTGWPARYGLYFNRGGDSSGTELSITNGTGNWDTRDKTTGISVNPGDEFAFECNAWVSGGGRVSFDFIMLNDTGTNLEWLVAGATLNTAVEATTRLYAYPGTNILAIKGIFKYPGASKGKAWLRIFGPDGATPNAEAYIWNMKMRRRNNAQLIVDGSIYTNHLSSGSVTADKLAVGSVTAGSIQAGAIQAIHISVQSITASKFVTDQGVDLASIVPGSLNWRAAATANVTYGPAQTIDSGVIAGTGASTCSPSSRVTFNGNATRSNVAAGFGSSTWTMTLQIYYSFNGGGWTYTGVQGTNNGTANSITTWYVNGVSTSGSLPEWQCPGSGTIAFCMRVTGSGAGGAGHTANISNPNFIAEVVNWK